MPADPRYYIVANGADMRAPRPAGMEVCVMGAGFWVWGTGETAKNEAR